jgi:hypothetical protein
VEDIAVTRTGCNDDPDAMQRMGPSSQK